MDLENLENLDEHILKEQAPWYKRRWWTRVRNNSINYKTTTYGTEISFGKETYIPFWGWPFELIYRLFFGNHSKIKPKD